ncbi:hypothetical protein DPMN_169552 [Dreissena polymorpha]|uniref:Tyrosine-protein kinase ephrin type A/B receptor-like domain-containing protein n=1 Tax=Dreissena polymorpha TaxID=45954 RepID=A0A9D4DWZ1_DREPO|nr:hypothetical protein DPMN_169552 [Dreissena polymorpha]
MKHCEHKLRIYGLILIFVWYLGVNTLTTEFPPTRLQDCNSTRTCAVCNAGYFANQSWAECSCCPRSGYCLDSCSACPPGAEQPKSREIECTLCKPGHFTPKDATIECPSCEKAERWHPTDGCVTCEDCQAGTFQNRTEQETCLPCPFGEHFIEDSNLIFGMHVYLMELHILSGERSRSSFKVRGIPVEEIDTSSRRMCGG